MLSNSRQVSGSRPAIFSRNRRWRARDAVVREGDRPDFLLVITQGWAARARSLANGVRQITGIFIPGDVCELFWLEGRPIVQSVVALSELRGVAVSAADIRLRGERDAPFKDLLWHAAQWTAEARCEWMVNLARRDSAGRIAHVFCEMLARQQANGDAIGDCCDLPMTQHDLGDLVGITPVHVNRTLQSLRAGRLIEFCDKRLRVLDPDGLRSLAGFDGRYLQATKPRIGELILDMAEVSPAPNASPYEFRLEASAAAAP
jgi:CRP-like cAMP-binding protein